MRRISSWMMWIAVACTVIMMVHVTADVIGRNVFNFPLGGTAEIVAGIYMVFVIFLPLARITEEEQHISVDVFTARVRGPWQMAIRAFSNVLLLILSGVLSWSAVAEALERTRQSEMWMTHLGPLPIWPSRWVFAATAIAMCVCAAGILLRLLFRRST